MVNIVRGPVKEYALITILEDFFMKNPEIEGTLFYGYPIVSDFEETYKVDAMFISAKYGVILFDFKNTYEAEEEERLADFQFGIINSFASKLMKNRKLMKRRTLRVNVDLLTLIPKLSKSIQNLEELECSIARDNNEILEFLKRNEKNDVAIYEDLIQAIQAITTIKHRKSKRRAQNANSKGSKLEKLEADVSNLDIIQTKAVIETVEGPQRIRGLAGSGKTIVLALKVAYLHVNNSDWNIAVTFNTRSLKDQFKELIKRFTYEHIGEEPDWNKIKIIHAWGGPRDEGIYYNVCKAHQIEYYDFSTASEIARSRNNAFPFICEKALNEISEFKPMYDLILIDEAQDFSSDFLRMCYEVLTKEKRLVFAYDELQSLNKTSMDTPENIFGNDSEGNPRVQLRNQEGKPKEDIILETCYRNSRPILATAHALGFGVYNTFNESLIQIFDEHSLWKEVGYKIIEGKLEDDNQVRLGRSLKSSPRALEAHSEVDEIVQFNLFNNPLEQAEWIANQIEENLKKDELEYKDIMVVHTDPLQTRSQVGIIRRKLLDKGIKNHLAGVTTSPDQFFLEDSITFTSIFRAKGNEAAMIYVVDAQNCYSGLELAKKRNILFTAITRSKAWVRISGYGKGAEMLKGEFEQVKKENFELSFKYPTEEERKRMHVVHRDRTKDERQQIKQVEGEMKNIADVLENGKVNIENLPPELINKLKGLIN